MAEPGTRPKLPGSLGYLPDFLTAEEIQEEDVGTDWTNDLFLTLH